MSDIELSPFVYKVKGQKKLALYDLLEGDIYQISTEGDVSTLKKQLLEIELAFETEGIIPFKYEANLDNYEHEAKIKDLQIRINGECTFNCHNCGSLCACYKSSGKISDKTLNAIFDQSQYIHVDHVSITGGNPLLRIDILKKIRKYLIAKEFSVMFKGTITRDQKKQLDSLEIGITNFPLHNNQQITEDGIEADGFTFFYNQKFNPCWGNRIAVDVDGTIKPCLWSSALLGNIRESNLKKMIFRGEFEDYWMLSKDKIDTCRTCEYRYGCPDCRVAAVHLNGDINAKTTFCKYDPEKGDWIE